MNKFTKYTLMSVLLLMQTPALSQALHWLSKPAINLGVVPNGSVSQAQISANGRFIAFTSNASNLIANDTNQQTDLFLLDTLDNSIERINSTGFNNTFTVYSFTKPTSDGSKIAVISRDTSVAGIDNPSRDKYVYTININDNTVSLESIDLEDNPFEVDTFSDDILLTDDGLSLFFTARVLLDPLHTSTARRQVYRKNLDNNSYELISLSSDAMQAAVASVFFDNASADGRFVTMKTNASNLLTESIVGTQLLRKDLSNNSYQLVTITPNGTAPSGSSVASNVKQSSVANNGHVAFISSSDELVNGDNNNGEDVFYFNGTSNVRVSLDENGQETDLFFVKDIHISGDATQLTFSTGTDLVDSDNQFFVFDVFLYNVNTQTLSNVSTNNQGTGANDSSVGMGFSADSDQLILVSSATDIEGAPNNTKTNLYSYNHNTDELSSLNSAIFTPNTSLSANARPKISQNQRFAIFQSRTNTLAPYAENSTTHKNDNLFLLDRETDSFSLVGRRLSFYDYDISPSGQYIVFASRYFQPAGIIDLGSRQLFVYDRINQTYQQIAGGNNPRINDSGELVFATNDALLGNDSNNESDVYLYDLAANAFSLISTNLSGQAAGNSGAPDISNTPNDTHVVFASTAPDLVASDINETTDVFLMSWPNGTITRVSQTTAGTGGNDYTSAPKISDNGEVILLLSAATNLTNDDYPNTADEQLFLYDTSTELIELITQDSNGSALSGINISPFNEHSISSSGRYVSYQAFGVSSLGGDNDASNDVFLYDHFNNQTTIVSQQLNGNPVDDNSTSIVASDVVEDLSVNPPLLGVAFAGSYAFTEINNHPGYSEIYLYQKGGPNVELNISVEGSGSGVVSGSQSISCNSQCDSDYPLGTDLILIATPDNGSIFAGWQSSRGQCTDNTNPCSLTMDRNKQLRAVFIDENDLIFANGFE